MAEVLHALQEIKFGSIEIIHDSQVVQVERKEKVGSTDRPASTSGRKTRVTKGDRV